MAEHPNFLFIDDDLSVITWYRDMVKRFFPSSTVYIAYTLHDAETQITLHAHEVDYIVLDGCVPGNELNTLGLIRQVSDLRAKGTFLGKIIAASSLPEYRRVMLEAGCDSQADKARFVMDLHATLSV